MEVAINNLGLAFKYEEFLGHPTDFYIPSLQLAIECDGDGHYI